MILTCPNCATRYLLDADQLATKPTKVRCANCGHAWVQEPPQDLPKRVAPEPAATALEAPEGPPARAAGSERATRSGGGAGVAVGWLLLLGVLAAAAWGAYKYKERIVAVWPPAAKVYALFDGKADVSALEFAEVDYKRDYEDGLPVLTVTGRIVNTSDQELPAPPIRVGLKNAADEEIYNWTFMALVEKVPGNGSTDFVTRLARPPLDARDLEIRFDTGG